MGASAPFPSAEPERAVREVKAPIFNYVRAESLENAIALLAEYGEDARILAGGQSLMPTLNMRLSQPEILIDINRIDDLRGITLDGDHVRIGALTRHVEVLESPIVAEHLPLIAEAMPHVAHVAVRNRGTFGGSIALADPAAEMPACVLALEAELVVEGPKGRRSIPADDYFYGLYETARAADEILVEARIPIVQPGQRFAFMELARRKGDFAMAGIACRAVVSDDVIEQARLVYFASELKPTLANSAAAALEGKSWNDDLADAVAEALENDLDPIKNLHGSAALKMHLQKVLTRRSLAAVMEQGRAA